MNRRLRSSVFLILGALLSPLLCAASDVIWTPVTWTGSGDAVLVGNYHPASRAGAWTWVLLHGLGSIQGEWKTFGEALAAQGDGVLIYDARGHGLSTHKTDGSAIDYKNWSRYDGQWQRMPDDLASAVKMLGKRFSVPKSLIAVGGASLGANVALRYAADHSAVPALILLSPGMNYAGVASNDAFVAYAKRPVFIAASPDDTYPFQSVGELARQRGDSACRVASGPGSEHGVNMFKDPNFTQNLLEWTKEVETKG